MHSCNAGRRTQATSYYIYVATCLVQPKKEGRKEGRKEGGGGDQRREQSGRREMPRRKVSMGLIPNRRLRANTFAKRKAGLKKKAEELSTLCGVRIALVCAPGDGAVADVWESAAGVIDAYRELPAEERARHTHVAYAEVELRKAEGKRARVGQDGPPALALWDAKIFGLALDEARRVLAAVDEAVRAVGERQAAQGLTAGAPSDAIVPIGIATPPAFFAGSNLVSLDDSLLRAHGYNANEQQAMWDNGFGVNWHQPGYVFQQCGAGSYPDIDAYKLQMAAAMGLFGTNVGNSIGRLSWDAFHPATDAVAAQPTGGYGFECVNGTGNSYVGVSSFLAQQQAPSNAIVPFGYPLSLEMGLNYTDAPAAQLGTGGVSFAGGNFDAAAAALSLAMSTGDNSFVDALQAQPLAVSYTPNAGDYASQWPTRQQPEQSSDKPLWEAL